VGTFTQLDTVMGKAVDPRSLNRFLYAEANPATLIDPSGHCAWDANSHSLQGPDCGTVERSYVDTRNTVSTTGCGQVSSQTEANRCLKTGSSQQDSKEWASMIEAKREAARKAASKPRDCGGINALACGWDATGGRAVDWVTDHPFTAAAAVGCTAAFFVCVPVAVANVASGGKVTDALGAADQVGGRVADAVAPWVLPTLIGASICLGLAQPEICAAAAVSYFAGVGVKNDVFGGNRDLTKTLEGADPFDFGLSLGSVGVTDKLVNVFGGEEGDPRRTAWSVVINTGGAGVTDLISQAHKGQSINQREAEGAMTAGGVSGSLSDQEGAKALLYGGISSGALNAFFDWLFGR
jgi:hypothetical protein